MTHAKKENQAPAKHKGADGKYKQPPSGKTAIDPQPKPKRSA
jgi:hypothetical protein